MSAQLKSIKVYNNARKFCGIYEPEAKTYFEWRKANQFLHTPEAISFSPEVLGKLATMGCKIICVANIETNAEFWIRFENLEGKTLIIKRAGYRSQKAIPLTNWKSEPIYITTI